VKLRHVLQIIGGILIASAGLYIFFRDVDTAMLWNELRSIPFLSLAGVMLLAILTLYFRSLRWRVMLPRTKSATHQGLFPIVTIGFMVNNILPARIGEVARAFILWKRNGYTPAESIGSLFVERFLDVLAYMALFFVPLLIHNYVPWLRMYALMMALGFCAVIIGLALYAHYPVFTRSIAAKLTVVIPSKFRPKMQKIGSELASNLDWLFSAKRVFLVLLFSILTIVCYPLMLLLLVRSTPGFGFLDSMFSQSLAAVGAAIPLAPGYVGTLHAVLLQGLEMVGMESDKARAVTILYHAISYLTTTILGLIFLFGLNISFKDIQKAKKEMD